MMLLLQLLILQLMILHVLEKQKVGGVEKKMSI